MDQKKRMQLAYFGLQELECTTGLSAGSVIHKTEVLMDRGLWHRLPFDLLVKVLSKLPVSTLMSFCLVCKRWRALIRSAEFAHQCNSVKPIAFFHFPGDEREETRPYLAFPNTKSNAWEKHMLEFAAGPVDLVAADQGLMCFRSRETRIILYMYNPLTRQWRKLTVPGKTEECVDMPRSTRILVGLVVDQETGNYTLVVGFVRMQNNVDDELGGTYIYDSLSSAWTRTGDCPDLPGLMLGYEGMVNLHLAKWRPGVCIRCGENLYWAVEEVSQHSQWEDFFRILLKYDLKTGTWTVDEPILPYERLVNSEDIPNCLRQSLPYVRLVEDPDMYSLSDKVPQWNVHLAAHDGTMFVTLFDSLINEEAFSGQFSALIPEVKVIDAQLVLMISELPDVPETYLPTKAIAQNEMWYVTFECEGVCDDDRARNDLYIFAYDTKRQVSRWLPTLLPDSSCGDVCKGYNLLYGLHHNFNAFAATFRAFV